MHQALSLFVAACFLFTACTQEGSQSTEPETQSSDQPIAGQGSVSDDLSDPNILQVAIGSPDHTTLVAAVQAAGLVDVLANNGPLTVFAPNNAAFDALPDGTVDDLLKPENKQTLATIITYHASPGTYKGTLLANSKSIFQATGHNVPVEVRDGDTYVNGCKILGTVEASNGVVHVIDKVWLPPEE